MNILVKMNLKHIYIYIIYLIWIFLIGMICFTILYSRLLPSIFRIVDGKETVVVLQNIKKKGTKIQFNVHFIVKSKSIVVELEKDSSDFYNYYNKKELDLVYHEYFLNSIYIKNVDQFSQPVLLILSLLAFGIAIYILYRSIIWISRDRLFSDCRESF